MLEFKWQGLGLNYFKLSFKNFKHKLYFSVLYLILHSVHALLLILRSVKVALTEPISNEFYADCLTLALFYDELKEDEDGLID